MHRACKILRSGDWLTGERIKLVAGALLIASAAALVFLVVTGHGAIDRWGRPIGTDFSNVYAAGTYVRDGSPAAPYDPPRQYAREQALFGMKTPFYGWHYPPYFLFVAGALATMPYPAALAVWLAATLVLYLLTIRAIVSSSLRLRKQVPGEGRSGLGAESRQWHLTCLASRGDPGSNPGQALSSQVRRAVLPPWLLLALAFPAVLINIGHGQNGFLTAALFGGALAVLDRRPWLAGIFFGLLIYKPQFGLMIPVVLAASGRWRSFVAATATVALLSLATLVAFGPQIWHAFFVSTQFSRTVVLEQGATGWYKIQSLFSWARMWGAPISVAYLLQGALSIGLAAALVWLWRRATSGALRAASLCLASILATPYTLDYDMMLLAPAIAFLAADGLARGFLPWEKSALATVWSVPLVARSVAHATFVPLAVPAMIALFLLAMCRAERERGTSKAFAEPSAIAGDATDAGRRHDIAAFQR